MQTSIEWFMRHQRLAKASPMARQKILFRKLKICSECTNTPSQARLGSDSFGDQVDDLFSKFNKLATVSLSGKALIWSVSVLSADQPIIDGCCMLGHPSKDRVVNRNPSTNIALDGIFLIFEFIFNILDSIFCLAIGLAFANR